MKIIFKNSAKKNHTIWHKTVYLTKQNKKNTKNNIYLVNRFLLISKKTLNNRFNEFYLGNDVSFVKILFVFLGTFNYLFCDVYFCLKCSLHEKNGR